VFALVLASPAPGASLDLARPIAGAPLLVRQLEWLRGAGVTRVAINRVAEEPLPRGLGERSLRHTSVEATWIPSARPLGPSELAERVEHEDGPVIVVPHARLGSVDLRAGWQVAAETGEDVWVTCGPLRVWVAHLGGARRVTRRIALAGWMQEVTSEPVAQSLSEQVLLGQRQGIEVRGSAIAPGIWHARGALAVRGAVLLAPCYLGRGSLVAERAQVGPGGLLGEHAIVEEGARVVHGRVAPGVVVGQGVLVQEACAMPGRLERHTGAVVELADPLLLGAPADGDWVPRLAAALALSAVGPLAALWGGAAREWARRLARVVDGRGRWLDALDGGEQESAVFDVLPFLLPPGAGPEERRAARALYARRKSLALDARLLAVWLLGAGTARPGA
jgi:hypothetical protein